MKELKKLRTQKDFKFSNGFETKIRDIFFVENMSTDDNGNHTIKFGDLQTTTVSQTELDENFFEH
jgi:hypothetical protein